MNKNIFHENIIAFIIIKEAIQKQNKMFIDVLLPLNKYFVLMIFVHLCFQFLRCLN